MRLAALRAKVNTACSVSQWEAQLVVQVMNGHNSQVDDARSCPQRLTTSPPEIQGQGRTTSSNLLLTTRTLAGTNL
eukprot:1133575-Pelagomonas_calceolata.AAC.2